MFRKMMKGPKPTEPKQEQQQQDLVSASSTYILPQRTLQPEERKVADLGQAPQMELDSDRLDSFECGLQQLQDTLDTPMSRWKREADPSQEISHHDTPLGGPGSSVGEAVLEDRSERRRNASQGASPITEPDFDDQAAFSERPVDDQEMPETITTTAPAANTSTTKISSVVVQCLKDLGRLVSEDLSSFASEVPLALWKDELGRLRVWAANIGAHQTGQSSLDHRLRDASHIKEQTLRVLQRLQRTTEDINDVLHHSPEDDDFSDLSEDEEDDDDDGYQTEIQSVYHALRDTINNLYQMSMVIRQPAQHDRLLGTKRSDAVFFEHFDRLHVTSKYPQAGEDILRRLGLAISQRRAVLRYRERHRTKLGQGLSQVMEDQTDVQSTKLSETVATEFVETAPAAKDDLEFITVASQTSYAQTILNGAEGTVLPSPPKESTDGAPFECPYCFVIISIANRRAWARHVFNDLMPYLCIFPNCPTPHQLYESRRVWFSHLRSQHSIPESSSVHVDCPLCLSSVPSGKQLERHVGRHLEELALFALPRSEEDDDEAAISSDADSDESHDLVVQGSAAASQRDQGPPSRGSRSSNSTHTTTQVSLKKSSSREVIREAGFSFSPLDWAALTANPKSNLRGEVLRATYQLPFGAHPINNDVLTVGELRQEAATIVGAPSPDLVRLLYRGRWLEDDNQTCKAEGLKQYSEVIVAVFEIQPSPRSGSSHYEKGYASDSSWGRFGPNNKQKKKTKYNTDISRPPPGPPSRHPSPAPPGSSLLSPPDLKTMRTAMEQVSALTVYFERDVIPLCDEYIAQPPDDIEKRDSEHKKLSEMVLRQVVLPVDEIEPGDVTVRNARKALVKQAQQVLSMLDAAARV